MRKLMLLTAAFVVSFAPQCKAAFVTGVTNGAGQGIGASMSAIGTVDNGSGVLASIGTPGTPSPEGAGARSINISVTVLRKFSPFNIQISTRSVPGTSPSNQFYTLNLTVVNGLTYGNVSHNYFNGFDFEDAGESASGISTFIEGTPTPGSGVFVLETPVAGVPNLSTPTGWRFGGLNGGGYQLAPGASTTISLALRVNQTTNSVVSTNRTSQFTITANPEPTSLLLGGLAMVPAVIGLRRRQKLTAANG